MPILIALLLAAAGTAWVIKARAATGKVIAPTALSAGKWYCMTVKVAPLVTPTTALLVQTRADVEATAQGFVEPLAVLPAQNADGTWAATITGLYRGSGTVASTAQMTILQVEEVNAPAPAGSPAA